MKNSEIKAISIINIILSLVFGIGGYLVIPQFIELFQGFGADLPALTNFVMKSYPYWIALIIIPILTLILSLSNDDDSGSSVLLGIAGAMLVFFFLLLPIIVVALYLPIFKLGQVV